MKNNKAYFAIITILFFIWGFVTCMNDILAPYLKKVFDLTYVEANLVQFSFFIAYFIGALVYYLISASSGDPINKIGYKYGIVIGLVIAALGLCLFYPAAVLLSFPLFLTALFVLGLGLTLLQICANPYVSLLGKPETASSRLNLAGGLNSFGTTIAPIIGGYLIFEVFNHGAISSNIKQVTGAQGAAAVKMPYLLFGAITFVVAIFFLFIHLPSYTNTEKVERGAGALKFPQLSLGAIAIFMYVGGEVSVGTMLTSYVGLPNILHLPADKATLYVALYWGSLMIGRFTGSAALSDMPRIRKIALAFIIPAVVFPFLVFVFHIKHFSVRDILPYAGFLVILALGFILSSFRPARTLMVFSLVNILLLAVGILASGKLALYSVVATGLFDSVMWPVIFTLAIYRLGKYTSQGSSILVMMILGGALMPLLQGFIADQKMNGHKCEQLSFIVPACCFMYLAFYGWKMRNLLTDHIGDESTSGGH